MPRSNCRRPRRRWPPRAEGVGEVSRSVERGVATRPGTKARPGRR